MMYSLIFLAAVLCGGLAQDQKSKYYSTYTGEIISDAEYQKHVKDNNTFWCTAKFDGDCDPNESRRLDLTCSNLQYPTRGGAHSPFVRQLPAVWSKDFGPAKTKSGKDMPPARKVRLDALPDIDLPDQRFSLAFVAYLLMVLGTQTSFHDTLNYMVWTPTCCNPNVKKDPQCVPHKILPDDTVHRFSGINCMNQTIPLSFQSQGCTKDKADGPKRVNSGSEYYALQNVYGLDSSFRSFKDGLLKVEEENGMIWPVSTKQGNCLQNEFPRETRCHASNAINALHGTNMFGIQFWREHNFIAKNLKKINPCWDDEKLFTIAREINIAFFTQIQYYELLPLFLGKQNMIRDGIITKDGRLVDTFKEGVAPGIAIEYPYVMRWGHTITPGIVEMYDESGNYMNQIPITNISLRTGYYALGKNLPGMTQGLFRQPAGKIGRSVAPFIAESGMGRLQLALDLTTADLSKGGLHGIGGYARYREFCTGKKYRGFADLGRDIDNEGIEIIKKSYDNVADVPLMLGVWLEKPIPGGYAPRTLYCIASKQYHRFKQFDRHWYENPNRPNAFNEKQMAEIRKMTVARLLCDVGDSITKITPQAFLREGPRNRITDCKRIKKVDYNAWKEC